MEHDFNKISFYSKLFKGRSNWYFCYLKSEKLAHVLAVLANRSVSESAQVLTSTATFAGQVVQDVVHAAAGEVLEETLLADLFSMISTLRLQASRGHINEETARILVEEYQILVEKLVGDSERLGLSVSPEDLAVPTFEEKSVLSTLPYSNDTSVGGTYLKDISKGHDPNKGQKDRLTAKGQSRAGLILDFVRKNNGVSIRDIAKVIRDCSEKTIQRELNALIKEGVVTREGERRWSTYRAA